MNYNKVILGGHLTQDPELFYLPSQTPVVEFGLATNRKWQSKDGAQKEEVCFIDCQTFGNLADNIHKYFQKGRPILIEGRLQFNQWDASDGTKRSKHRVVVESFTFVDSKQDVGSAPDNSQAGTQQPPATNDSIPF